MTIILSIPFYDSVKEMSRNVEASQRRTNIYIYVREVIACIRTLAGYYAVLKVTCKVNGVSLLNLV